MSTRSDTGSVEPVSSSLSDSSRTSSSPLQQLAEIAELARKATPGKWYWECAYVGSSQRHAPCKGTGLDGKCENIEAGRIRLKSTGGNGHVLEEWSHYADDAGLDVDLDSARYIASCSPDTILAIEAAVRDLVKNWKEEEQSWSDQAKGLLAERDQYKAELMQASRLLGAGGSRELALITENKRLKAALEKIRARALEMPTSVGTILVIARLLVIF